MSYYLLCHRKSGASEKVPVGDLMKRAREEDVMVYGVGLAGRGGERCELPEPPLDEGELRIGWQ